MKDINDDQHEMFLRNQEEQEEDSLAEDFAELKLKYQDLKDKYESEVFVSESVQKDQEVKRLLFQIEGMKYDEKKYSTLYHAYALDLRTQLSYILSLFVSLARELPAPLNWLARMEIREDIEETEALIDRFTTLHYIKDVDEMVRLKDNKEECTGEKEEQ